LDGRNSNRGFPVFLGGKTCIFRHSAKDHFLILPEDEEHPDGLKQLHGLSISNQVIIRNKTVCRKLKKAQKTDEKIHIIFDDYYSLGGGGRRQES
jgi:hypothetical protein